ncbi:uncharacterized protein LOC117640413 [Thrips palmi]|uniref:Uncharacterized protein LOC117640413 n=1 Tax=Thrips palmi TaxID=161013 RepID=A0A6P8Y031_THRPL|nr:uncharacterized protein LOC117640413 [Thrips palmi]
MDQSFSLDENGNRTPFKVPNATSTPRKTKNVSKLVCQHCGKTYQLQFYFEKHVATHSSDFTAHGTNTADLNVSNAVHIDTSNLSFSQLQPDNASFKIPNAPQKKKKVVTSKVNKTAAKLICTYCLKAYICKRSFKTHLRTHIIQSAAKRFPDGKKILENCEEIADKALLEVSKCISVGESGQRFKHLVGHIAGVAGNQEWKLFCHGLCGELVDSIKDKMCILPSTLVTYLIDKHEKITSSSETCDALLKLLNLPDEFERNVLYQFLLELSLIFLLEIVKFISKTFRSTLPQKLQVVTELDKEDRQVIYYIGGSIMRGYLKIARRSEKSKTWQSVASVIKTNILMDKPVADIDPDSEWTISVDRGSLLYINAECQRFFVKLTKVVYANEQCDGSIDYDKVITCVTNSELSVEWGTMIGDSLPETVSVNLMNDVVLGLCRTCGRGFAKRRLNALRNRPMVSMPTRHLVASRKNR